MTLYDIRPLSRADLDLVNGWITRPHVATWWVDAQGPPELIHEDDFDEPDFRMWLVHLNERPFAYIQDYDPHLYEGHHFFDRKAPARGIDQFIGEADLINQGHGSAFIRQHRDFLIQEGAVIIVTDPDPDNHRAIRAYEKAGFQSYGHGDHPEYGKCLLMQYEI